MTQPQKRPLGCKVTRSRTTKIRAFFLKVGLVDVPPCCDTRPPQKQLEGHFPRIKIKLRPPQEWNTFFLCLNFYGKSDPRGRRLA